MSYWLIFLTGLTTGGLSCLALQGGLLASAIVEEVDEEGNKKKISRVRVISVFLISKLIAYTILGVLLGALGKFIGLSPRAIGILNILISLFMIGVAGEALKIHPIFRYFLIQPPKFVRKKVKNMEGKEGDFAAIILGFFTVLIPCGVTQAMMAFAVSSANFISGATIMFVFILGTIPVFFILGYLATTLGAKFDSIFRKVVGVLLILLAVYTFVNGTRLLGFKLTSNSSSTSNTQSVAAISTGDSATQKVTIKLNDSYGYSPSSINIKKGIPVEVTLQNDGATGCIRAFVIPDLNKRVLLPASGSTSFTFTPTTAGRLNFTCSMGMYSGAFIVN